MKKFLNFLILVVLIISCCSCGRLENEVVTTNDILKEKYSDLNAFKGIEIYVWNEDDSIYCGMLSGTNMSKETKDIELLKEMPATLKQMNQILESYDLTASMFSIASNTTNLSKEEIFNKLGIKNDDDISNVSKDIDDMLPK